MPGKMWGGRFTASANKLVEEWTSSIAFDQKLGAEDIKGSIAHATMLGKCGIISQGDAQKIFHGLKVLEEKFLAGELSFSVEDEDIHMNIERLLVQEIGPVGGKLHTGRSRNDQVATDMHLYLNNRSLELVDLLEEVQRAIISKAQDHVDTVLPGYTHLQRAQPISFAHHLMAYFWMFQRDKERLLDSIKRCDTSPLGACALAGTHFPIDPEDTAKSLGFSKTYPNSIDAVSDRDFILEFLAWASIGIMHVSRLAEELVLWSSQEFGFIELDDSFCTGSSIMPQKKNPDVPELLRGKTGRIYGNLMGLLTVMKGLPLAYNKDLQEDKEGMFDTVATMEGALRLLAGVVASMKVNASTMKQAVSQDYSAATDIADYLVKKGLPFREAHGITGQVVLHAINSNKYLGELELREYQGFSPMFQQDIFNVIQPEQVVAARTSPGGTGQMQVKLQIEQAKELLV